MLLSGKVDEVALMAQMIVTPLTHIVFLYAAIGMAVAA